MVKIEGDLTVDTAHFLSDLQRFKSNPTMSGRAELVRKYPPQEAHEVNTVWKRLPREEKAREVLLEHYKNKFGDLIGRYEFEALPTDIVPNGEKAWKVADAVLGGSFRGGDVQPFTLEVRAHDMRLISERGQRAIDLNLIPGEEMPLVVYPTADFYNNGTHEANIAIREAGPLRAAEIFMDVVYSLPVLQSKKQVAAA